MPRLRGPIRPGPQVEKQRKKSIFSKIWKLHKSPGVTVKVGVTVGVGDSDHESAYHVILNDYWRQGLGNYSDQYQSKDIILKLANILGTVYMMGGRVYTVTSHWDVFSVGTGGKQTYFTPAPWSFLMWPVIHFLLLGSCIYQFSHQGSSAPIDREGWKFPLLQLSNAMYNRCRSGQWYKFAFIWIVVTYMVVNKIYRNISRTSSRGIPDQLFCHLPLSLYHGWVLGLVFLACFEAFGVDAVTTPAHSGTKTSVLFSFVLIQLFEWAYASPAIEGDFFACLSVSWFLFAVTVEQSAARSAFVHWSAHGFTIFSLCWITKCMIGLELRDSKKGFEDEERAPLIGG